MLHLTSFPNSPLNHIRNLPRKTTLTHSPKVKLNKPASLSNGKLITSSSHISGIFITAHFIFASQVVLTSSPTTLFLNLIMACFLRPVPSAHPNHTIIHGLLCCGCGRFTPSTPTNLLSRHADCPCSLNIHCSECIPGVRCLYWRCWACSTDMRGKKAQCTHCGYPARKIGNVWYWGKIRGWVECSEYGAIVLEPRVVEGWEERHGIREKRMERSSGGREGS
ncbi:hypothetical protein EX30DRAFT_139523 [Ascodesmis nigricans]|uniref:Uncharacterized protein n=1 Tax=Ascodesmis nigricans TaxID=341454 RepID=A0A4S2N0U2_9PEZI|nr:hypothetical protein EX30DRAFT_139523 [Ascodesmis nigricans]